MNKNHLDNISSISSRAIDAQKKIRSLSLEERVGYITKLKNTVLEKTPWLIEKIVTETKKTKSDALMSEIFPILDHLDYLERFAVKTLKPQKAFTPLALMGKKSQIRFEPLGWALIISPWNYPLYQALTPITTAFMAGNATVYKPSEHTPLHEVIETLLSESDFATNWVQVIYGDGQVASSLIDLRPNKIFFTGSVSTGKKIMAHAAKYLIPVELELGGKDPMIIFEDVHLNRAVAACAWGALTNSGQSCTSVERVYIDQKIYERFKTELLNMISKLTTEEIGKITVHAQLETIIEHVKDALKNGAKLAFPKSIQELQVNLENALKSGFLNPIVIELDSKTQHGLKIVQEETFGPVITLMSFRDEEHAIELANDSQFGLSASVFSKDLKRANRVADRLVTGNVSINNVMLTEGNHALPFGGVKNSGFGRFKGIFGLQSFSNIKSILIDQSSNKIEANWYPYTNKKFELFSKMMAALFSSARLKLIEFAVSGLKLESHSNQAAKDVSEQAELKRPAESLHNISYQK